MRDLLFCKFYEDKEISHRKLQFAVIVSIYKNQLVFVRHKDRDTYEVPGGKRNGYTENINECACRELVEETGATKFNITPLCTYGIRKNIKGSSEYYGKLFYAEIEELGELPDTEIGEVILSNVVPENLTYPHIQPNILKKLNEYRSLNNLSTF